MIKNSIQRTFLTVLISVSFLACSEDDETITEENTNASYTITVGVFTLNNEVYTAVGNELVFDSAEECQTWSRTAQGDTHDSDTHLHYNAAAAVSYTSSTTTFTWTEYGPELDEASIGSTCSAGANGVTKTVNSTTYYQDKTNVYLKITSVVEN